MFFFTFVLAALLPFLYCHKLLGQVDHGLCTFCLCGPQVYLAHPLLTTFCHLNLMFRCCLETKVNKLLCCLIRVQLNFCNFHHLWIHFFTDFTVFLLCPPTGINWYCMRFLSVSLSLCLTWVLWLCYCVKVVVHVVKLFSPPDIDILSPNGVTNFWW